MIKHNTMLTEQEFRQALRACSLKATPQRLAVHAAMLALEHAGADSVAAWLAEHGAASVTVASVYNTLSRLAKAGIYRSRMSADAKMYFDANPSKHIHFYDSVNHTYRNLYDEELYALVEERLKRRRLKGYKIDGIDLQVVCHPTRRKAAAGRD